MGKAFYRFKTECWAQDVGCADIMSFDPCEHYVYVLPMNWGLMVLFFVTDIKFIEKAIRQGHITMYYQGY